MRPLPFADDHPLLAAPCVWHPTAPREGYAVVHFRTTFVLDAALEAPVLWASAVQRFVLYLDGRLVARGPSRSPAGRRSCARVAPGPLAAGSHTLVATVAHFGGHAGQGELDAKAFFVLWGEGGFVRTGGAFRCLEDRSRSPSPENAWGEARPRYDAAGAGERVDGALVPWGFERPDYDDTAWAPARELGTAGPSGYGNYGQGVRLAPDPLPPMDEHEVANDDRLARKAVDDLHLSRTSEGLVPSRAPARHEQIIPAFSLPWVGLLRDLLAYRGGAPGLVRYLPAVRETLDWFTHRLRLDGLLGPVEHWSFFDWAPGWERGQPPAGPEGGSAPLTLLFAEACGWARDLERACGYPELASRWDRLKRALAAAVVRGCFRPERERTVLGAQAREGLVPFGFGRQALTSPLRIGLGGLDRPEGTNRAVAQRGSRARARGPRRAGGEKEAVEFALRAEREARGGSVSFASRSELTVGCGSPRELR